MAVTRSDPFDSFAAEHGLNLTIEEIVIAPRDILAAPADQDHCFLMTVSRPPNDVRHVRTIFIVDGSDSRGPTTRDALWWLASDAWGVERASHDRVRWATENRFHPDDPATQRQFQLLSDQAGTAKAVLGDEAYRSLLELYEREVSYRR